MNLLKLTPGMVIADMGAGSGYFTRRMAKRIAVLPDVPTLDESGLKGFEASLWLAVVAPAKTPAAIVERMNAEVKAVLADPDVVEALKRQGIAATPSTPDELRARIEHDVAKWKKLAQETGITMEQK